MKRLISVLLVMVMLLCSAAALAEQEPLQPWHEIDMEHYGEEDWTVMADFDPNDIEEENNVIVYDVYDNDYYAVEDIEQLQPGDQLAVNNGIITVVTIEKTEDGYSVNGGFLENEENGATLVYAGATPDVLVSVTYNDLATSALMGQAAFQLADIVTITTYQLAEDTELNDEEVSVTLPAEEVKDYLIGMTEPDGVDIGITFNHHATTITLINGKVAIIEVEWTPVG